MRVLITGASGLLGKNIYNSLSSKHDVVGFYNKKNSEGLLKLDLENHEELNNLLNWLKPSIIIHTAAITDLNLCEENPLKAKLVNSDAVWVLAQWCNLNNSKLVFISTDYVFDGCTGPYKEDSITAPIQIYGYTKLLGEIFVERCASNHAIIRIGILHGYNDLADKNTVTMSIINSLREGKRIVLDNKRLKYPTLIDDVSRSIEKIIGENLSGIFHVATQEPVTRYEWGLRVATKLGINTQYLVPDKNIDAKNFPKRPQDVKLVDTRANFDVRSLDESIEYILKKVNAGI